MLRALAHGDTTKSPTQAPLLQGDSTQHSRGERSIRSGWSTHTPRGCWARWVEFQAPGTQACPQSSQSSWGDTHKKSGRHASNTSSRLGGHTGGREEDTASLKDPGAKRRTAQFAPEVLQFPKKSLAAEANV